MNKLSLVVGSLLLTTSVFGMNKAELVNSIVQESGLSKADAKRAIGSYVKEASKRYKSGKAVVLPGVGVVCNLEAKERANKTKCSNNFNSEFTPSKGVLSASFRNYFSSFNNTVVEAIASDIRKEVQNKKNSREQEAGFGGDLDESNVQFNPLAASGYHNTISHYSNSYGNLLSKNDPNELLDAKRSFHFIDDWQGEIAYAQADFNKLYADTLAPVSRSKEYFSVASKVLIEKAQTSIKEADLVAEYEKDTSIIDAVKKELKLDKEIDLVFDIVKNAIEGALSKEGKVSLVGFGSFSISKRAARTGRNPQTGKEIKIAAKNVVRFKAGSELSDKVN